MLLVPAVAPNHPEWVSHAAPPTLRPRSYRSPRCFFQVDNHWRRTYFELSAKPVPASIFGSRLAVVPLQAPEDS